MSFAVARSRERAELGQRFVVGVAAGNAELSSSSGPLPSGYHSRVVNKSDDELIVFAPGSIIPKYLIIFK